MSTNFNAKIELFRHYSFITAAIQTSSDIISKYDQLAGTTSRYLLQAIFSLFNFSSGMQSEETNLKAVFIYPRVPQEVAQLGHLGNEYGDESPCVLLIDPCKALMSGSVCIEWFERVDVV